MMYFDAVRASPHPT